MTVRQRNATALGFVIGLVFGYLFFLDDEVSLGSVLAVLFFAVGAAGIGWAGARTAGGSAD